MPTTRKTRISDSVSSRVTRALQAMPSPRLSAFTLAELIVVVSILAVLATIGFLALSEYQKDAKNAVSSTNVRSVYAAISSESAVTGYSARYYVLHDPNYALSGGVVAFDGHPTNLVGGNWDAPGTNYSVGNPDYAKLKMDREKFRISSLRIRTAGVFAAMGLPFLANSANAQTPSGNVANPSYILVGAADATDTSGTKNRVRNYIQVAAVLPSGTATISGNFPVSATGGSTPGLIKDTANPSGTGTLIEGAVVGSVPGCDANPGLSGYEVPVMTSGETTDVSKTAPNGNIQAVATCSFGIVNIASETAICEPGYVPAAGPSCVANVCGGAIPLHATSNSSNQAVGTAWHYSTSSNTCTFVCDPDYSWNSESSSCKADCTGPRAGSATDAHSGLSYALSSFPSLVHGTSVSFTGTAAFGVSPSHGELTATFAYACTDWVLTKNSTNGSGSCETNYTWNSNWTTPECTGNSLPNQACTGLPTGGVWNTASTITQTWSGNTKIPSLIGTYGTTASTTECRYQCGAGYGWDSGTSTCETSVVGTCGTAAKTYPYAASSYGSDTLCALGNGVATPTTPAFPGAGTSVSWTCGGSFGGAASANCTASRGVAANCAPSIQTVNAHPYPVPAFNHGTTISVVSSNVPVAWGTQTHSQTFSCTDGGITTDGGETAGSVTCFSGYALIGGSCIPTNCKVIKATYPTSEDNLYSIDPDGAGGATAFSTYCDMTTDGGGWTLAMMSRENIVNWNTGISGTVTTQPNYDTWSYNPLNATVVNPTTNSTNNVVTKALTTVPFQDFLFRCSGDSTYCGTDNHSVYSHTTSSLLSAKTGTLTQKTATGWPFSRHRVYTTSYVSDPSYLVPINSISLSAQCAPASSRPYSACVRIGVVGRDYYDFQNAVGLGMKGSESYSESISVNTMLGYMAHRSFVVLRGDVYVR